MAEIIEVGKTIYLHFEGFLYSKHSNGKNSVKYWRCRKKAECSAKLTTVSSENSIKIHKGSSNDHEHPPNREEVAALKVIAKIKSIAIERPEAPPVQVMRCLQEVPSTVLAELPDRQNIKKRIQRERLRDMPSNPQDLDNFQEVPETYRRTIAGESFLLYDSFEDKDYNLSCGRILIFCTEESLKTLAKSQVLYVDGTFKTSPSLFYQVFVIMGSIIQINKGVQQTFVLPFIYALLEGKEQEAYTKVFEVMRSSFQKFEINCPLPQLIMSDFELAVINSAMSVFGDIVRCCLFHLCQSVYRRVQSEGLQAKYNDENNRTIKEATQMMCALAFVPTEKVPEYFDMFMDKVPEEFACVAEYFEVTYIRGKPARGRRKPVAVRYSPKIWNNYEAVLGNLSRTNNASEGWHNRFRVVTGRDHPSLYAFFNEMRKEQADTETMLRQLSLGQKIKKKQENRIRINEERLLNIVSNFQKFVDENNIMGYLKAIGYNLKL